MQNIDIEHNIPTRIPDLTTTSTVLVNKCDLVWLCEEIDVRFLLARPFMNNESGHLLDVPFVHSQQFCGILCGSFKLVALLLNQQHNFPRTSLA